MGDPVFIRVPIPPITIHIPPQFVATTFAPTNVIDLYWPGGFYSSDDDFITFFTNVEYIRASPVPEPGAGALLGTGLMLLLTLGASRPRLRCP